MDKPSEICAELDALLRLSARIGRDPLLVQASSGNTSLKRDGTLWVKASGKWLAHANCEDILVPVDLGHCRECFERGLESLGDAESCGGTSRLHPSIETFMHAVLPYTVVIHVHSVNTIAWAVRRDALLHLSDRLHGLAWQWIPYVSSGLPLARQIQVALSRRPDANIFILANHGLVVCGDTCEAAEAALLEVERRLALPVRHPPNCDSTWRANLDDSSLWRLPDEEALHALATDSVCLQILRNGTLFPCQAIFLGAPAPVVDDFEEFAETAHLDRLCDQPQPYVILAGKGVLVNKCLTAAQDAVLRGLLEVTLRVGESSPVQYLTPSQVDTLMGVEGHAYRRSAENNVQHSFA